MYTAMGSNSQFLDVLSIDLLAAALAAAADWWKKLAAAHILAAMNVLQMSKRKLHNF